MTLRTISSGKDGGRVDVDVCSGPAASGLWVEHARRRADLRRSFCLSIADGIVAMPMVTMALPVNVFLAALFTKGLGLSKATIGFIVALPFVCNILQLAATPVLSRWLPPKVIIVAGAAMATLCWISLGVLLFWLPAAGPAAAGLWLASWYFILSVSSSVGGVAWNAWMQAWVPARLRGKFFGRRNRTLQFSILAFMPAAGWVLVRWNYAMPAFQAIIAVAVGLRFLSLYWLWITPAPVPRDHKDSRLSLRRQFAVLLASRSLLRFTVFGALWSFATNCFGPFCQVFMMEQLRLSSFEVGMLSTLAALGGALALPAWGRLLDHHGNKSVMTVSLLLWQFQNLFWCVLTPELHWLNYAMWAWGGVTSAGFLLGQLTLLLKLIPAPARNLAVGFNLAATSAAAALAPVLGGLVLDRALAHWPDRPLDVYHVCFIFPPVLSALGAVLLLRLNEPRASELSPVIGAMRNIRTLSGIFGLGFLANHLFDRSPKR